MLFEKQMSNNKHRFDLNIANNLLDRVVNARPRYLVFNVFECIPSYLTKQQHLQSTQLANRSSSYSFPDRPKSQQYSIARNKRKRPHAHQAHQQSTQIQPIESNAHHAQRYAPLFDRVEHKVEHTFAI